MGYKGNALLGHGIMTLMAISVGILGFAGCEQAKPTIGEQVGDAIDESIQATNRAATNVQQQGQGAANQLQSQLNQARTDIHKETLGLRDAVKQAVDDHLGSGDGK